MPAEQLNLTNDELLGTTRAVRKRLDLERPVPERVLRECLELAIQAPTGSNAQGSQFVLVTDADTIARIGALYGQAFAVYRDMPVAIHKLHADSQDASLKDSQNRSASSADYLGDLGDNMGRVPAMLIPCITGRTDGQPAFGQAGVFGSILPAVWSFMLAARARGLGTAWTTLHLMHEKGVAELLDIPFDSIMQVALIPIAYTRGTRFKPAYRPLLDSEDSVLHVNGW